ncbi:hypothetical protein D3C77_312250 [compost metagenome]
MLSHLPEERITKHLLQRNFDLQLFMYSSCKHHRFQRVPSQLKEMILSSNRRTAEDV